MLCSKCAANLPEGSQFCLKCGEQVSVSTPAAVEAAANAALACSNCGATLPEGGEFCSKCGKPVALPAQGAAAWESSVQEAAPLPRKPRKRRIVLRGLLAVILIAIVWAGASDNPFAQGIQELVGWKHDHTILDKPFSVSAHSFRFYKFSLPEGSVHVAIMGQFTAASQGNSHASAKVKEKDTGKDADNNIEVYVLSEPAFTVWQNGYATSSVYESGSVSEGKVQADLPAGAGIYYLVFSNKFAPKTAKNVSARVLLRYKSWLPEWFRRMKDRALNWLGL